jgi:hypothetical protein
MGAFVDEEAVVEIDLEREYCPPKPDGTAYHEHDTVTVRTEYGYGDVLRVNNAGNANPAMIWDSETATLALWSRAIKAWSFVDAEGKPVPVGIPMMRLLDDAIGDKVGDVINDHYRKVKEDLPKPSAVS